MAKQLVNQRRIYKIQSSRFRLNKWELDLNETNTHTDEIVSIGDNQVLDFIRQINQTSLEEEENEINELKRLIKNARKNNDKKKVKQLYSKLNSIVFVKDLCFVVIDKVSDYHKLNKKMKLNGVNFKRLFATTGGVKTSTIIYVSESVHEDLCSRIENGRDMSKEFSAGKLEAYKALTFSNSVKVRNPRGIIVVDDYVTNFKDTIIELDDSGTKYPTFELKENEDVELIDSDGYCIISPRYAEEIKEDLGIDYLPSGSLLRSSFIKGMGFVADYCMFSKLIAGNKIITDAYGDTHNVEDVDIIMPKSVFKLWDSYKNIQDYIDNCNKDKYSFRVAKVAPKQLENERNLNYQFIQPLYLSDSDIEELCKPTVEYIKEIVNENPFKSILFTKGVNLTDENIKYGKSDFTKALMIEPSMINDPFVKTKIHDMAKKRIKDAKIGVLKCPSNFQIASGDIYGFMEHIFNIPHEQRKWGLLKSGEVYSKYWADKNVENITIFRAPMSSHNNIRKMKVVDNKDVRLWYKYIETCMIFNSWDTVAHALNGMDKDADAVFSTDSDVIYRNTKELPAVMCKQKPTPKKICEFDDFVKANINGFGDAIGSITNKITSMFCIQSQFGKDSAEYKELEYRIICGQLYQQNAIDKIKSIESKPMPMEWFSHKPHINKNEDGTYSRDEFNLSIIADKKPYFFIHNYRTLAKEYNKYMNDVNIKSMNKFGTTYDNLCSIANTDEELEFVNNVELYSPVYNYPSTMNRLCWHIENELNNVKFQKKDNGFDYTILKSNATYKKSDFEKISKIYSEYKKDVSDFVKGHTQINSDDINSESQRQIFIEKFKEKCSFVDEDSLCNTVLDLCYNTNTSKQFAWDVCGETILTNLLKRNNYRVNCIERDENGELEFSGEKFTIKIMTVGEDFARNI